MARKLLLLLLFPLAACTQGAAADLPTISTARSLGAEWALVNEQASRGQLTAAYATTMRRQLRDQLESSASSLKQPNSRYDTEIQALLAQPDNAPPEVLRVHSDNLKQIEGALESA